MPWLARFTNRSIAFDSDGGGGGGTGDSGEQNLPDDLSVSTEQLEQALRGVMPESVMQSLKNSAEEEGGWKQLAQTLANDNKKLRDKNRKLTDAPKGAVIIPPEEADALARIKKHGELSKAAEKLEEADELKQKIQRQEKAIAAREALKASGVDADAFMQMDGARSLQYDTVKTEQENEDGETVTKQMGVVRVTEQDDAGNEVEKNVPIRQYIEDNYSPFKGVLLNGESGGEAESEEEETQESGGGGPRFPRRSGPSNQGAGKKQKKKGDSAASNYLKKKYARNSDS